MIINGSKMDFPSGITVREMLERLGLSQSKVVVEVNLQIVKQNQYNCWILNEEDQIEIVRFIGGG